MTPLDAVLDQPAATVSPRAGATAPYSLLVADDQPDVIASLRLLFGDDSVSVEGAGSPAEALALAAVRPFDAALVDLNYDAGVTSGRQGLDLVGALSRRSPTLPIVVMTAWGSSGLADEAIRLGAKDFIEKPWEDDRMARLLRSHLELGRALRRVGELETDLLAVRASGSATPPTVGEMRLLDVEGQLVRRAMERHRGNVSRAARALGLSRSALYRRLERHKIP